MKKRGKNAPEFVRPEMDPLSPLSDPEKKTGTYSVFFLKLVPAPIPSYRHCSVDHNHRSRFSVSLKHIITVSDFSFS